MARVTPESLIPSAYEADCLARFESGIELAMQDQSARRTGVEVESIALIGERPETKIQILLKRDAVIPNVTFRAEFNLYDSHGEPAYVELRLSDLIIQTSWTFDSHSFYPTRQDVGELQGSVWIKDLDLEGFVDQVTVE